jgi:hypothetical protein
MTNQLIDRKFYLLVFILFVSIMTTNQIHNDSSDTLLTIINFFIIVKILHVLFTQLVSTIFKICNP